MKLYAKTDVGKVRATNQDAFCTACHADGTEYLIVCDGMGGRNGGNIAAELVVDALSHTFRTKRHKPQRLRELRQYLLAAVSAANQMVCDVAAQNEELRGMGSTVVFAYRCGEKLALVHVGDSRAYLLRSGRLRRLTKDHSLVQTMLDRGEISSEQVSTHPYRHVITRVLGSIHDAEPSLSWSDIRPGDVFLLCSDGLSSVIDDEAIKTCMSATPAPHLPDALVSLALARGAPDNVTVGILLEEESERVKK